MTVLSLLPASSPSFSRGTTHNAKLLQHNHSVTLCGKGLSSTKDFNVSKRSEYLMGLPLTELPLADFDEQRPPEVAGHTQFHCLSGTLGKLPWQSMSKGRSTLSLWRLCRAQCSMSCCNCRTFRDSTSSALHTKLTSGLPVGAVVRLHRRTCPWAQAGNRQRLD